MKSQHRFYSVMCLCGNVIFKKKCQHGIITGIIHSIDSCNIKASISIILGFFHSCICTFYSILYQRLSTISVQCFFHSLIPSFITFT